MRAGDPAWRVAQHTTGGEELVSQAESDGLHRGVLPIPDSSFAGTLPYDARDPDASFPAIEPLRPPAGAPNVLVVLLDDGESSVFTGTVNWVQIDLGEDAENAEHVITPELRLRVAMARQ